jgi:rubredoxin
MKSMKCAACGYLYLEKNPFGDLNNYGMVSSLPFIALHSTTYTEVQHGTDYARVAVKQYACPKCFTLRIEGE